MSEPIKALPADLTSKSQSLHNIKDYDTFAVQYCRHLPDQSFYSKSDNSGEQEERGDQDVKQCQSCKGLRRAGNTLFEEVMHHKRLQDKILKFYRPITNV